MARRATVINRERANGSAILVLDAGNSLVGDQPPASTSKGASSIEALNLMHYDAIALGTDDLKLGPDQVKALIREATFPVLSANAVLSTTGELIASPYALRQINGRTIALIGLTGVWDKTPLPDTLVLDPLATATRLISEIKKRADLVIVLSNAGTPTDLQIADTTPGIDLIVSGGPFMSFETAQESPKNHTFLVHAEYPSKGHTGRNIGRAVLTIDGMGKVVTHTWQLIPLGPEIPNDPQLAEWRAKHR